MGLRTLNPFVHLLTDLDHFVNVLFGQSLEDDYCFPLGKCQPAIVLQATIWTRGPLARRDTLTR